MVAESKNIILTGIPRSGTTLTCYLLNQAANTVALAEPMDVGAFAGLGGIPAIMAAIETFFVDQRGSLLSEGTALTKAADGAVRENYFSAERDAEGYRKNLARSQYVQVGKALDEDFYLVVKHPNAFTALLGSLVEHFPCHAIVRNPLAALASWNSIDAAIRDGRVPMAEALDAPLRDALAAAPSRETRQLHLLSWYFETYRRYLPDAHILRYETLIATGGKSLAAISPTAAELSVDLQNKNTNDLYDSQVVRSLGGMLLDSDGAYWDFYSKDAVRELLEQY